MSWKHIENVARAKVKGEPGWEICRMEWVGGSIVIEGGVGRSLKSGKNKGRTTWRECTKFTKTIVTEAEIEAEERRYEAETGNCHRCLGSGEEIASAHVTEGKTMRPCRECKGSGKAKEVAS